MLTTPKPVRCGGAEWLPHQSGSSLKDRHFTIHYGDTGFGYEKLFGPYLTGAKAIVIEDPYIRLPHQIANFTRFCELVVKTGAAEKIRLVTGSDDQNAKRWRFPEKLDTLVDDLKQHSICIGVYVRTMAA